MTIDHVRIILLKCIGLQLFGDALKDVKDTLEQCDETDIAKKLEKFIEALIQCTECKCLWNKLYKEKSLHNINDVSVSFFSKL